MKKSAVVGTGSIGSLVGGYLIRGGEDVTMISAFQRDKAQLLREQGLRVTGNGDDFHVAVNAAYLGDLPQEEQFDVIFLALKSNDLAEVVPKLLPHLKEDGCLVSLQNGINEDYLISQAGAKRVVAGTTFAGGHLVTPCHMESHEGFFRVGEVDGTVNARTEEIAAMLRKVRPSEATPEIRGYQWDKLARVCLSVPSAAISGLYLGDVFMERRLQKLFALLALELFAVAEADGSPRETVENKTRDEWIKVRDGQLTGLEGRDDHWPPNIVDAYTMDIRAGRPLEIGFTNGAVVRLGQRYGVPTPINAFMVDTILKIEAGTETRGFHQVKKALALAGLEEPLI
jgi:2-dehydropantoate 2-reductase